MQNEDEERKSESAPCVCTAAAPNTEQTTKKAKIADGNAERSPEKDVAQERKALS